MSDIYKDINKAYYALHCMMKSDHIHSLIRASAGCVLYVSKSVCMYELQLNKANSSDSEAPILDLNL